MLNFSFESRDRRYLGRRGNRWEDKNKTDCEKL